MTNLKLNNCEGYMKVIEYITSEFRREIGSLEKIIGNVENLIDNFLIFLKKKA